MSAAPVSRAARSGCGVLLLDAEQTRSALPFGELIPALQEAFAAGCKAPLRHHHFIERPTGVTDTLLLMPAWREQQYLGVKIVTVFPDNSKIGMPALSSSYLLCDGSTGRHLAIIDGNELTGRRTVAASALAASFLARKDASSLVVVGAGRVASLAADAFQAVRPIEKVTVWDINASQAAKLVAHLQSLGFQAHVSADLEAAVQGADIVTCATLATSPLIKGAWLKPGTHLDLIGSFTPAMREADDEAFRISRVFVDTPAALEESGDLLAPIQSGAFHPDAVRGNLETLSKGEATGRGNETEITLFKSVGTAIEDLAAAALVYRKFAGQTS
jgi:ornithine cyclodeaminase/alanine dehydrogenase-like protein (mu-crystallin family)